MAVRAGSRVGPYEVAFFPNYDVTPDATQFLMVEASAERELRLHVVLHWADAWSRQ